MAPDSPTRFKGPLGVMKRVTWAEPLPLFEVKALSEVLKCSVNDVLVSCVTAALRTYLLEQGDPVEGIEVRALVPVNLRPPGRITELGNRFGMVFLSLPIGLEDPIERVLEVHKRMGELKGSQQPLVALGILAGMGIAPEFIKERVLEALAANASVVITNVRGIGTAALLRRQAHDASDVLGATIGRHRDWCQHPELCRASQLRRRHRYAASTSSRCHYAAFCR